MTVHDIKKMFNLLEIKDEKGNIIQKEQYKNGSDFKKRVLDKAKNDIRNSTKRDFVTFVLIIRLRARTPEVLLLPTILSLKQMVILQDLVQRSRLHQHRLRFCLKVMVQN